jgi:hypothetical protein
MSLIGNIDGIPVFTTRQEAELWGRQYNINGFHTHVLLGQLGYMAGFSHADIQAANLNVVANPLQPIQVRQATANATSIQTRYTSTPSVPSSSSSGGSSSGGGY